MSIQVENLIIGQGLAGSAVTWTLHLAGQTVYVVDRGEPATASRVSAGLITPLTGKKLVKSADFNQYWTTAKAFYRKVEQTTGTSLLEESTMLRLFADKKARQKFFDNSECEVAENVGEWSGQLQASGREQSGIRMSPAGRLKVADYLAATKRYLKERGCFVEGEFDLASVIGQRVEGCYKLAINGLAIDARRIIICTGASLNGLFPQVPNNPSRGDILEVSISDYQVTETVHRSIWIAAAEQSGRQLVGSTYDWKNLSNEPTQEGRQQVLAMLERLVDGPVDVHSQRAALRPTMKDYEPVVGCHEADENLFIVNGLGSKGSLKAPQLAEWLKTMMEGNTKVPAKIDVKRLTGEYTAVQRPLTILAQDAVAAAISSGDLVIDATVGNGFDTCFLSKAVSETGSVIGFDLQQMAIDSTSKRLVAAGSKNVKLIKDSHENLSAYVQKSTVGAVMFNLGYLPRSDKSVVTKASSTVKAISSAIDALKPNGVLTVLAYRGHEGGPEEFEAVEGLLLSQPDQQEVTRIDSRPAKNTFPVLFVLKKTAK